MNYSEFNRIAEPYIQNETVRSMSQYVAHGKTNVLQHSYLVARKAYVFCKVMKIDVDMESLVAGALLHDLYLYDWHKMDPKHKWHGKTHGVAAYNNAKEIFNINPKTRNIIESHMWPLNIKNIPKSKEAVIVSCCDKFSASIESIWRFQPKLRKIQALYMY